MATLSPMTDVTGIVAQLTTSNQTMQAILAALQSGAITSATAAAASATAAAASATSAANSLAAMPTILQGNLGGLTLSNNTTTSLAIAAGSCTDNANTVSIALGAFTKSTAGAWASGSGSNGMGAGLTIAASTWYHVFAIINSGLADVYFDTSVNAANKPANTTAFRRLGSIHTNGSSQIEGFVQHGDEFLWTTGRADVSGGAVGTASRTAFGLTVPASVQVNALFRAQSGNASAAANIMFTSGDETDQAVAAAELFNPAGATVQGGRFNVRTNTSNQIFARSVNASTTVSIQTFGWIDIRGRG